MKVIIAGSREIDEAKVERLLPYIVTAFRDFGDIYITEVVSGAARGVDLIGERYAKQHNIPIKRFLPDWERFGKAAGPRRNAEMAKYADALIAIWDGKSRGTQSMIDLAKKHGLKLNIYFVKEEDDASKA